MSRTPSRKPSSFRIRSSIPPRDAWLADGVTDILVGVAAIVIVALVALVL